MTRNFNLGVLIRERLLLSNHHRKLFSDSIQTQTLTLSSSSSPSPSPHTIFRPLSSSSSTPKLPFSYNSISFSLHSRNLHSCGIPEPFMSLSRYSLPYADPKEVFSNVVVIDHSSTYYEALKTVQDERISAVFFYTDPNCSRTLKSITPIFHELCEQYRHIKIYMIHVDQNGNRLSLHKLGVKSPTFHFYLNGEKVDELASASVPRLKKTLANVYNPSGMKKRRTQAAKKEKHDEGVDLS